MRSRKTPYLSKEQMLKLNTKRLLAYRKSLLTLPEWRNWPDWEEWKKEYDRALKESKEILDTREHVESY